LTKVHWKIFLLSSPAKQRANYKTFLIINNYFITNHVDVIVIDKGSSRQDRRRTSSFCEKEKTRGSSG